MKNFLLQSLRNKLVVFIFILAFAAGLSLVSGKAARADGGSDGHVVVNGMTYDVEHKDGGPIVEINGMKIPVQGHDSDRFIIFNGKRYDVTNEDHHVNNHERDHRDHKDHKDNGDHKDHNDHKDHGDHKDHKDHGDHSDHHKD